MKLWQYYEMVILSFVVCFLSLHIVCFIILLSFHSMNLSTRKKEIAQLRLQTWNSYVRWNLMRIMYLLSLLCLLQRKNARKWTEIFWAHKSLPIAHTTNMSMPSLCYNACIYVRHCMKIVIGSSSHVVVHILF